MQIVWKLWNSGWRSGRRPRILYLADRNILIDQPRLDYFVPAFGEGPIWTLRGAAKSGREIYFALYQALADSGGGEDGIFREFAADFFDLVIVDECHRGSATAESSWRRILERFAPATQLGMTATPKRDETADSYAYFGDPLFEYSLAQGIEDGFLAPYRVRRVVLSADAHGWAPTSGQMDLFGKEIPAGLYTTRQFERVVSLLSRTEAAARHLTDYLKRTDRWAKTIVFCVDQEHADQMRRALHNANADLTKEHPDYVVRIVSEEGEIGRGHMGNLADTESDTPVIATTLADALDRRRPPDRQEHRAVPDGRVAGDVQADDRPWHAAVPRRRQAVVRHPRLLRSHGAVRGPGVRRTARARRPGGDR